MSQEIAIHNRFIEILKDLDAARIEYTSLGEDQFVEVAQHADRVKAMSVIVCPESMQFGPGRGCDVSRRTGWTWRAILEFRYQVDSEDFVKSLVQDGAYSESLDQPDSWYARLLTAENIPRPALAAETGTHLTLRFEILSR